MKIRTLAAFLSLNALLLVGCSTVETRVANNRAAFESWSPEIQQLVSEGRVAVGLTPQQVEVALGKPDRVFARTDATGTFEVWSYRDRAPRFGFGLGLGMGSYRGGSAYGGGVSVGTGGRDYIDERLRVVFDQTGRVNSVEHTHPGRR